VNGQTRETVAEHSASDTLQHIIHINSMSMSPHHYHQHVNCQCPLHHQQQPVQCKSVLLIHQPKGSFSESEVDLLTKHLKSNLGKTQLEKGKECDLQKIVSKT